MFEGYSEKAQPTIFVLPGQPLWVSGHHPEHLLPGLVREDKTLYRWLPRITLASL